MSTRDGFVRSLGALCVAAICARTLQAQAAAGFEAGLGAGLDERIASTLAAFGTAGVSVAVVQNGSLIYAKGFGHAKIASALAAGTDTRYAVGSISKQFTAAALLLEQERGKLSLDDKVSKYFPRLTTPHYLVE
ncbi:MAG TPA: serine hydrolase domain-containing protein [Bryobacteraceae bacterium]|nr:serine hydrolase domain-containing protein [Bryobacteraceae bacterium]